MKPRIFLLLSFQLLFCAFSFCAQRATSKLARQIITASPSQQSEVERACHLFECTPGFLIVLKNIARSHGSPSQKGYWYELEKALLIHKMHSSERQPRVVQSFGTIVQSPAGNEQREFDIIALQGNSSTFYECKNRKWRSDLKKLEAQFIHQQRIVAALRAQGNDVEYVVASKQPFPPRWKHFFEMHAIETELD